MSQSQSGASEGRQVVPVPVRGREPIRFAGGRQRYSIGGRWRGVRNNDPVEGTTHNMSNMQIITAADGGQHGGGGGEGDDGHPGQPWTPPQEPPSPDGDTPPGDGTHRK